MTIDQSFKDNLNKALLPLKEKNIKCAIACDHENVKKAILENLDEDIKQFIERIDVSSYLPTGKIFLYAVNDKKFDFFNYV